MHFPRTIRPSERAGSPSRSLGSRFAIFGVAAAMIAGTALLGPGAAFGATGLAVTTPTNGATGVQPSIFSNVVSFSGTGLPAGDTASVSYLDADNNVRNATFGGSSNDGAGNWTGNQNFGQLSTGQKSVVATVIALDGSGVRDSSVNATTVSFEFAVAPNPANPFTVTSPVSNSATPVASTTPTFAGTGNPDATITITYGARALATETAASVKVKADGTWTTPTDFSQLEPGATDGSAIVTEYGTNGAVFPGTSGQRINFVFPSAPSPLIPLTLVTVPKSSTLTSATTTGVAFSATGFSPGEEVTLVVTDSNDNVVTVPKSQPNFYANTTDGSFSSNVILPTTSGTGTYTITVTGVRSAPVRTVGGTFTVVADPANAGTPPVVKLPVVSG